MTLSWSQTNNNTAGHGACARWGDGVLRAEAEAEAQVEAATEAEAVAKAEAL